VREISVRQITDAMDAACREAVVQLPGDLLAALRGALERETKPQARDILALILQNAEVAVQEGLPTCQDTGVVVAFADVGMDGHITGGTLQEAVDAGVSRAYTEAFLRPSVLRDPLDRAGNSGDNTPAVLHVRLVPGDRLSLTVAPKGGGAENMSALWMLTPATGPAEIVERIAAHVAAAGGRPCPPLVLGVAIGGNFEQCALLAKRAAAARRVGQPHPDGDVTRLEREILAAVNATGVGPMGMGGDTTALAVHVELAPCHIASLPVALNVQCHAARHKTVVL